MKVASNGFLNEYIEKKLIKAEKIGIDQTSITAVRIISVNLNEKHKCPPRPPRIFYHIVLK